MTSDFVTNIVNRSNRNLLLRSLLGIVILVVAGVFFSNYLYNFISGPFTVEKDQLIQAKSLGDLKQQFITVKGDEEIVDTGYQYVTGSGSDEKIESYYEALVLDDKLLLVKSGSLLEGQTTVTGGLTELPSDVQREVIADLEREYPNLKDTFLPFMLDTGNYRLPGFIGLAVAAVVLVLVAIGLGRYFGRVSDPAKHPIMKSLNRFGDANNVAQQIEMEMAQEPPKVGNMRMGRNWLIQATGSSMNATRYNDVMWAYKQITQHRTNGIPTGKTFSAMIFDRHGSMMLVSGKEKLIDETLQEVARRAPGSVVGFSKEIQDMWKSKRAEFVAAVDQRRQQAARPA